MKIEPKIIHKTVMFGCDPEFFFEKDGKILGSEMIIDKDNGLTTPGMNGRSNKAICDGVQVELNMTPHHCRQQLALELAYCFSAIKKQQQKHPGLKSNFKPYVKVTKARLKPLSDKSKVFGCMPSKGVGKEEEEVVIRPSTYQYRSAGGHLHIGKESKNDEYLFENPERIVNIMDILVGNTAVLLDRDPGNALRRQIYGKAGEYRTPSYGIEYRTLSNFWLRSYPLMSLVTALARMSISILYSSIPVKPVYEDRVNDWTGEPYKNLVRNGVTPTMDFEKELLSLVDMQDIHKAINTNDYKLALKNYKKIKPFFEKYCNEYFPLHKDNLEAFETIIKNGVDHYFTEDPVDYWSSRAYDSLSGLGKGWESFASAVQTGEIK